jgi:chemosensory pili system protein ChpA (sensor histidine kinase/response regulator)
LANNEAIVKSILVPEIAEDVILDNTSDSSLTVTLAEELLPQLITEEVTLDSDSTVDETNQAQPVVKLPKVAKLDTSKVDAELFALFTEEANEILSDAGSELRAWHSNPQSNKHVDALARALHTLKGSARMAGQMDLGNAVHMLESQVIEARKGDLSTEVFDNMFADLDMIGTYFEESIQVEDADDAEEATVADAHKQPQVRTANRASNYLRMQAATLDRLINEAGEISIIRSRLDRDVTGFKQISTDLTDGVSRMRTYLRELELEADSQLQSRLTSLQQTNENFDPLEFDRFTRLQELTRLMAESVNDIATIQSGFITNLGQAESALQQQNRMNRDLQQTLMSVRMLPFSLLSERMQRIVRQTARELKKRVELVIDGEKTEIDRSVLDKIGAPLEHLLRNAIAHGIETPAERKKAGKPEMAIVRLQVSVKNDEINITVSDDGQGVDLARIKQKAIETGLIQANANISEQNLMALMFESGFSTAEKVTKVAGRGVGLDVVRNEITSLGGRIDVDSQSLQGAQFSIHLPVTLTVAQVLMVRAGNTQYALSVAMIEQAQKIKQHALVEAYAAGEIAWGGNTYPLYQLSRLLNPHHQSIENSAYASILLLRSGTYHVALHVDDVIGNQEIVIKTIGEQLARVPSVMGATVTADGKIVLMINPVQMANREVLAAGSVKVNVAVATKQVAKTTVLVVDDSLTMRKVLSRILERDGYEVMIAKDGLDAMQVLQENVPDIILTDIEMPRMDGFGLSRNIRDDVRTKSTPLIMISSRTADKHQNLAKEIGVDAFFGKPVSDEDLLSKIKELIQLKHIKI